MITASVVVLVPFLFALGTRVGKEASVARSPLLGRRAPGFDLVRIDQQGRLSQGGLRGHVYVINFWASWCVPCRQETPDLDAFYQRWQSKGVELVGILYGDTVGNARAFRKELGGTWPLVDDHNGRVALDYGVRGVPETFVVDERGVIMAKLVGAVGPRTLDDVLNQIESGGEPIYARNDQYRSQPDQ